MTIKIMIAVILGIGLGIILPDNLATMTDPMLNIGLCLLLFFVGLDIGKNKSVFQTIKASGTLFILTPLMIVIGSLLGSVLAGFLLGYPINEASAIGAGLGWYTLSAIIIAPYSAELSVLAFLTNVVREILAIILIPIISKRLNAISAIAPSGATAMDTTLPIISQNTNGETAVLAFSTGFLLSMLVPFLVPLVLNIPL